MTDTPIYHGYFKVKTANDPEHFKVILAGTFTTFDKAYDGAKEALQVILDKGHPDVIDSYSWAATATLDQRISNDDILEEIELGETDNWFEDGA